MNYVFLGPPGAGKGTQAKRLCAHRGMPHISTGDMLRAAVASGSDLGREAQSYLDAGTLVPDEVIGRVVAERIAADDCTGGFLLDGFPRTLRQAELLDDALDLAGRTLDRVLLLVVPADELQRRILARGEGRSDDHPDVVAKRLEVYESQTAPLKTLYEDRGVLHAVDGVGTIDEVWERVLEAAGGDG